MPSPTRTQVKSGANLQANPSDTGDGLQSVTAGEPALGPPKEPGDLGTLGQYRILKKIGIGGMGVVYLGFDESLQRNVALKVMLPKVAVNAAARERFLREARASAAVEHPNVVAIYQVGEHAKVPYLAMQYLQGQPLDRYLAKKGPPGLGQILRVARETIDGLAAAHAKGLVHRDIKPANLWLEVPHGRIKILDFGLAKPTGEDDGVDLTQNGVVVGTPAYMAPEQARAQTVDGRSDLFSVGAVLYRLCTGTQPFRGANVMAVLSALAVDTPTPVRELNAAIPQAFADLVHRLLEKDPARRPQSAAEVSAALKAIEKGLQLPATAAMPQPVPQPLIPMQIAPQTEELFANLEDSTEPTAKARTSVNLPRTAVPRKKKPLPLGLVLATVAVAVALVAGVAVLAFGSKPKAEPTMEIAKGAEKAKPVPPPVGPTRKFGTQLAIPEKWIETARKAPLAEQLAMVEKEFKHRNRLFNKFEHQLGSDGAVVGVKLTADEVEDLTPLQAFAKLSSLQCNGSTPSAGRVSDLAPLAGLPISSLNVSNNSELQSIAALKDMPLDKLNLTSTGVIDLAALTGKDFDTLSLFGTKVTDLQPLAGAKIGTLNLCGSPAAKLAPLATCKIADLQLNTDVQTDLAPLVKCQLEKLKLDPPSAKLKAALFTPLHDVKSLIEIQGVPAATFWLFHDGRLKATLLPKEIAAHTGEAFAAVYSPDGTAIASVGADKKARIWDLKDLETPRTIDLGELAHGLAFLPGSDLLVTRSAKALRFWNARTGKTDGESIPLLHEPGGLAVSADGKRLVVVSAIRIGKDTHIRCFALPERKSTEIYDGLAVPMRRVALSPDGHLAFVGGDAGKAAVFDLATGKVLYRLSSPDTGHCVANLFAADGVKILCATDQGEVAIADWKAAVESIRFRTVPLSCAAFGPGEKTIVLGTRDGWLAVLDAATRTPLGHAYAGSWVKSIAVSPDGSHLLTAHQDGKLREWNWALLSQMPVSADGK